MLKSFARLRRRVQQAKPIKASTTDSVSKSADSYPKDHNYLEDCCLEDCNYNEDYLVQGGLVMREVAVMSGHCFFLGANFLCSKDCNENDANDDNARKNTPIIPARHFGDALVVFLTRHVKQYPKQYLEQCRCLAVLVLLVALLTPGALAQNNATTEELERDIAVYQENLVEREREQAEIEAALGELADELAAQIAERDRISVELVNLRRDRQALEGELAALESQVVANEARIVELEGQLEQLETRLQALLVGLHKQRSNRYAQALADADSFFELRVRNHYLSELANQDVSILEDIRDTVRQLADTQTQLAEQVNARSATLAELQATETRLAASQGQLEQVISDLEASQAGQLALRQDIIQQQNSLEVTISSARSALASERERLAREAAEARRRAREAAAAERDAESRELLDEAEQTEAAAAALAVPSRPLEDGYALPFANPQLSKRYGEEGPYVFLRAEQDYTAVRAVKSGVVQIVQPVQANTGYLVVIAHDSELLSAYQNLQAPQLEIGDWVDQSDIIGYLGGGTLIPADTLKFFIGLSQAGGGAAWVDPEPRLGFAQ